MQEIFMNHIKSEIKSVILSTIIDESCLTYIIVAIIIVLSQFYHSPQIRSMFPLLEFIFGPRVYGILTPNRAYQANLLGVLYLHKQILMPNLEYSGNTLFTISNALMNSLWVLSPIILPYTVFHFNQGTFVSVVKFSFYLTFSAYALRTFGRVTK